jgi:hypothetical protein
VETGQWAALIVIVRKADGYVRICGDYKVTINPYLESNVYPMPNPGDLFATLPGGARFSSLDMKQAYQQMQVEVDSQDYLTVNTNKGLFTYTRMPFGICTAPSIWQKEMDIRILAGVPRTVCYIYDILVVGENETQHDEWLMIVLQRLDKAGLKLKPEKCEFNKTQVEYLGRVISDRGIHPSENKVTAIRDAPPSENVTELQAF